MSLGNFSESGNQESAKEVKFAEVTFLSCNLALCGTDIEIAKFNENLKSAVMVLQKIQ